MSDKLLINNDNIINFYQPVQRDLDAFHEPVYLTPETPLGAPQIAVTMVVSSCL